MKKTQIQPSSDFDNKGNRTCSVREKRVAVVCVIVIAAACISSIVCLVYFLDGGKKATGGETPSANTTVPTQYGKPPPYILGESGWITWGSWSSCDVTCGGGSRVRSRVCYTTDPSQTCHGKSEHISSCAEWNCPDCNQGCQHGVLNSECLFCECQNDVISGTTKDIAGRPLEGVSIYRAEYPVDRIAVTAATGYFEVVGVCSADYTLMIKSNSFVDAIVSKTNTDRKRRSDESSVHLNITLEREVPPVIVKHPRNKVRTVGQSVRLCCAANGKPSPDYYECLVIVDNGDTGCSSKPLTHLIKLPTGCTDGSGSNSYNIGKCSKEVCASQEDASIECVNAEEYCCSPVLIDDVTVLCDGFDVSIQVVSECGCMACGPPTTKVIGRAGGVDGVPLPYGDIYIDGEHVGQTSATGEFSIEVSKGKKRLALTFRDKYNLFIDSATKIINILDETEVYHQIFIQRLADPVTISATEKSTVPLGTNGHIELDIPGDGFYTEDGLLYTGDVKATVTFNDPSDPSAADTMESDFTTRDIEGNTQLLKTYGVFNMKFQDESSNNLRVDAPMEIFINADQANIDLTEVDDDGNPSLRLWILNQISGEWEDFGGLGIVQEKRKKRDTENFLVGNIDVTGYDLSDITINLDKPMYWSCFLKVRVYEDEAMKQLLEGVQVTAITNDLIRRTHSEIGIGAGIFSFFKKETTDAEGTAITSGCQLKSGSDGVNPGLLSFIESYSLESHIQQDDTNFQFKVPDGNSNGPTTGLYFAQGEGITGYDNAYKNCNAGDDNAHSTGVGDNPDVGWALQYECN
ncbi:cartilage intermediate layer protein 1-like [Saccoglossus kowalevskii]